MGVVKKKLFGSIWVACARRASSRCGEVLRALDAGGDPVREDVELRVPVLEPLLERTHLAVLGELVLEQLHPLPQEPVVVVQLRHAPRLARVREQPVVGGGLVRGHRHLVAADVVGVRVAAVLVVGGQHVRLELADEPDQRAPSTRSSGTSAKQPSGSGGSGSPSGSPESTNPSQRVLDAEDLGGLGHLVAADLVDPAVHVGQVHRRVEDVAALAAGQRHHHDARALVGVTGHRRSALAGLVVRVGVHRHQPQFAHSCLPDRFVRRDSYGPVPTVSGSPIVPVLVRPIRTQTHAESRRSHLRGPHLS